MSNKVPGLDVNNKPDQKEVSNNWLDFNTAADQEEDFEGWLAFEEAAEYGGDKESVHLLYIPATESLSHQQA